MWGGYMGSVCGNRLANVVVELERHWHDRVCVTKSKKVWKRKVSKAKQQIILMTLTETPL